MPRLQLEVAHGFAAVAVDAVDTRRVQRPGHREAVGTAPNRAVSAMRKPEGNAVLELLRTKKYMQILLPRLTAPSANKKPNDVSAQAIGRKPKKGQNANTTVAVDCFRTDCGRVSTPQLSIDVQLVGHALLRQQHKGERDAQQRQHHVRDHDHIGEVGEVARRCGLDAKRLDKVHSDRPGDGVAKVLEPRQQRVHGRLHPLGAQLARQDHRGHQLKRPDNLFHGSGGVDFRGNVSQEHGHLGEEANTLAQESRKKKPVDCKPAQYNTCIRASCG